MRRIVLCQFVFGFLILQACHAQTHPSTHFTHADTLRGSLNAERDWWNVTHYSIAIQPEFDARSTKGTCEIRYSVLTPGTVMQIDLQQPLTIASILWGNRSLSYTREGNVFHVTFPVVQQTGSSSSILISYEGNPQIAKRPPWDGGWIFTKDKLGRPWMSVACQGIGASIWYPCKDHQSDEPDSGATVSITVPDNLVAVGNGRLVDKKSAGSLTTYTWQVVDPINNYDIIPYIGKYVTWQKDYAGINGKLTCNYWVLDYDLQKAKKQFLQADSMLKCFEYWYGPYPFYKDGYKLVEAPHLGMEHQSAVAYGNKFMNGYLGEDLSHSGWGLKWDFIIVHESGHEWFGNSITTNDLADMWVHEGFTNYSETLYTDCQSGIEAGNDYVIGTRKSISNDKPIIAHYGVNEEGSQDMYYKGGNLLHTIRQVINDDEKFRKILHGLNSTFYHKTVNSRDIEQYISTESGTDFSTVFDQYLRTTQIPVLEYKIEKNEISFRYTNCVPGFNLKLKVIAGKQLWITPGEQWQSIKVSGATSFRVDRNFYLNTKKTD